MKLAAGVVAILVAPLIVVAFDPDHHTIVYEGALFGLIGVGVVLAIAALTLQPRSGPEQPFDERRSDRYSSAVVLFMAAVLASVALLSGASRPFYAVIVSGLAVAWSLIWLPRFMRRVSVQTQVFIERDQKSVFEFVIDFRNMKAYTPDLISVEKVTDGDIGAGTRFLSRVRIEGNGVLEAQDEIVDVEWGRRFSDRVANGRRPNLGVMTFAPSEMGTLVSYRFDSEVSYPNALLGRGLTRGELTRRMRQRRTERWARLKQLLESQPDA